jgi:hypothetical protein
LKEVSFQKKILNPFRVIITMEEKIMRFVDFGTNYSTNCGGGQHFLNIETLMEEEKN